jgi:hypothetical protein
MLGNLLRDSRVRLRDGSTRAAQPPRNLWIDDCRWEIVQRLKSPRRSGQLQPLQSSLRCSAAVTAQKAVTDPFSRIAISHSHKGSSYYRPNFSTSHSTISILRTRFLLKAADMVADETARLMGGAQAGHGHPVEGPDTT